MLSPCHPMACPAMPCHDTRSRTQTGQPLWPGLISCHSRWSRNQGHCVVCSLTAQDPGELPLDTDRAGAKSACMCAYIFTCLSVCMCGNYCVLEADTKDESKKKSQDVMVKGISGCSVHILPRRQAGSSFHCKCG